jgi:endonuclease YncB( thermonuclease family)
MGRTMRHSRDFRGRSRFRAGELRLAVLGGVLLGLVAASWQPPAIAPSAAQPAVGAAFGFCHSGGGRDCVVDGDTFRMGGERIRIADIDAPETHPPRCAREADLGGKATRRLHALLNAGPITLESADRDEDRYGRKLRIIVRDGESLGEILVTEGLAHRWSGSRRPWC